ncbi:MAG: translation initiation factor IF-2 subunit beta [Candidatus Helarchaeota archaeon]
MNEDDYKHLLARAREMIPQDIFEHERFSIPPVQIRREGNKTIIENIRDIANRIRRDPEHLMKYLLRELATRGFIRSKVGGTDVAIFQGKFHNTSLNNLIAKYTKKYVICENCNKPDTRFVKEGRYLFLVCEACGSRRSVPQI